MAWKNATPSGRISRFAQDAPAWGSHLARTIDYGWWWAALLLLLANDHGLKGSGLLPGAVTGKLSDFAGLLVAPPLLCGLLLVRSRAAKASVFALVGMIFAAINVHAGIAQGWDHALAAIGIPWHTTPDPTDLVALSMLPLAAWLVHRDVGRLDAARSRVGRIRLALGAMIGAAACIATSLPPPQWSTTAFLINHTGREVDVRVRYYDGTMACEDAVARRGVGLRAEDFGPGLRFVVSDGDTLPLDRSSVSQAAGPEGSAVEFGGTQACDVVLVQADALPDTLVMWSGLDVLGVSLSEDPDNESSAARWRGVTLKNDAGALAATAAKSVDARSLANEGLACYPRASRIEWSHLGFTNEPGVIEAVGEQASGCLAVQMAWDAASSTSEHVSLCMDGVAFPFEPGDRVRMTETQDRLVVSSTTSDVELQLVKGQAEDVWPFDGYEMVSSDACEASRSACGSIAVPIEVQLSLTGEMLVLREGDEVTYAAPDGSGRSARLRLGRTEARLFTHSSCADVAELPAPRADYAILLGGEG